MADSRMAQFASADPKGADLPFWEQKVYFDGVPRRRREIVPTLAHTPGMNEATARFILMGAEIVGGDELACPPEAWFADDKKGDIDPEGRWITISGNHVHIDKSGEIDAGGPPAIRNILAKRGNGGAPTGPDHANHISQAIRDWGANKAYRDNSGNYRLKGESGGKGKIAPWNKAAKQHFKDVDALHEAASAAKGQTGSGKPLKAEHPDVDLFSRVAKAVAATGLKRADKWDGSSPKGKLDPAGPLHDLAIQAGYGAADLHQAASETVGTPGAARSFRNAIKKAVKGDFGPEMQKAVQSAVGEAGEKKLLKSLEGAKPPKPSERPMIGRGDETEADTEARYKRGEEMHKKLLEKGKLDVETPEGKKFTIHHKKDKSFNLFSGYGIQEEGSKKIGPYKMLDKGTVHGWLGQLKERGGESPAGEGGTKEYKGYPKDLTKLTGDQSKEIVGTLAKLPLKELRRRQDLADKQIGIADAEGKRTARTINDVNGKTHQIAGTVNGSDAGDTIRNPQIMRDHLDAAVQQREFPDKPAKGKKAAADGGDAGGAHTMSQSDFVAKYGRDRANLDRKAEKSDAAKLKPFVGTRFTNRYGTFEFTKAGDSPYNHQVKKVAESVHGPDETVKLGQKISMSQNQLAEALHTALVNKAVLSGKDVSDAALYKNTSAAHYLAGHRDTHGLDMSKLPEGTEVKEHNSDGSKSFHVTIPGGPKDTGDLMADHRGVKPVPREVDQHLRAKGYVNAWGKSHEYVASVGHKPSAAWYGLTEPEPAAKPKKSKK